MIPHAKHPLINRFFAGHARRKLRATFAAVRVAGVDHAVSALAQGPVVFVANHTSWWDSIVLIWLANDLFRRHGPSDAYALMDARNLRRYAFFRRLGVFGVDLDDPQDRTAVVDYARGLLDAPGRSVWIFPQGAERPITEPLAFFAGAARMASGAGARVVPMALRYEFGRVEAPFVYLAFGPPLPRSQDPEADVQAQTAAVGALMARLEDEVRGAARGQVTFEPALEQRRRWMPWLAERVLSAVLRRGRR